MRFHRQTVIITSIIVVFLLQTLAVIFFYMRVKDSEKSILDKGQSGAGNDAALIASVSRLITLPKNEQPMIATVGEKEKSQMQQYFPKVKPGDKILVYVRTKKAIIYDPVQNRVLDVAFLDVDAATKSASASASAKPTP